MPSKLFETPGYPDSRNLDNRYGKERSHYRTEIAEQMARMDDLIEKAGVKPGDKIEVYYTPLGNKNPLWVKPAGVFKEVDNGRFRFEGITLETMMSDEVNFGGSLSRVLDIRKRESQP